MKRIAILSAVNIKHMSLISLYTDILKEEDVKVDLIYMDKYDEDEYFKCDNKYRYINVINRDWNPIKKAYRYFQFVPYAKKIMNKQKYDFIIVWNDVAIFLFADYLRKKYPGKYCLNVRDNMKYDKKIFQKRYEKCFLKSAFNTVSSKGYFKFLPKKPEYIQIHSLNLDALEGMNIHTKMRDDGEPIRIGFIGYVRFLERNKKLLDVFANDNRFELHYYGKGSEILEEYAKDRNINNAVFYGSFPVEDTKKYLEKIDVINNLYGNENINLKTALSIKFYHALYARIPILISPKTYVGTLAQELGYGFEVDDNDLDDNLPNRLFNWYHNIDYTVLNSNAEEYLDVAKRENNLLREMINRYLDVE